MLFLKLLGGNIFFYLIKKSKCQIILNFYINFLLHNEKSTHTFLWINNKKNKGLFENILKQFYNIFNNQISFGNSKYFQPIFQK